MNARDLIRLRLRNQRLTAARLRRPEDVVTWMGAVQAQEYPFAKWGVGLRMRDGTTDAEVEDAFEAGRILRTHVMRPTWHFVTPADIGWMQKLTGPKVQRMLAPYSRRLGLDSATIARATRAIERALRDRRYLTRGELAESLRRARLPLVRAALAQVAMHAEAEGVICSGPRRGKQFTYALVAERAPQAAALSRDEALASLTRRYFQSHGPATVKDFVWWSGLGTADARRGLDIVKARSHPCDALEYWTVSPELRGADTGERVHLLPIYDEYTVAYRDRAAVPHGAAAFRHALVVDGQIAGTWRTTQTSTAVVLDVTPCGPMPPPSARAQTRAVERYTRFLGTSRSVASRAARSKR